MRKIFILIILSFIPWHLCQANSKIEIKYKVGDEIVTNLDILDERKYLVFLRPNLNGLKDKELSIIAENSLIREIIKKKEIKRIFKDDENLEFMEEIKKNLFRFKNVSYRHLQCYNRFNYVYVTVWCKNRINSRRQNKWC